MARKDQPLFFGSSPDEKKARRHTPEARTVKLSDLDMNAVDRSKFDAPEKVGETIDLIDIAMGSAPAGPPPELRPKAPEPVAPVNRMATARAKHGPASPDEKAPGFQVEARAEPRGALEALALLAALVALALVPGLRPLLRQARPGMATWALAERQAPGGLPSARTGVDPWGRGWHAAPGPKFVYSIGPDGVDQQGKGDDLPAREPAADPRLVTALAWGPELAGLAAFLCGWLALAKGRLRQPRGGRIAEAVRILVIAAGPWALGAGLVAWLAGALPVPVPAAAGLARELLASLGAPGGVPGWAIVGAVWGLPCLIGAVRARRR